MASDNTVPLRGTPGVFDPRNPTLLPNFDQPVVPANSATDPQGTGQGSVSLSAPADFVAAFPRVDATATATIGASATSTDILTIEASSPIFPAGFISHTYTVAGGDTLNTIADELAQLFNDDPVAASFGLRADVEAAVITFHQGGPVGNFTVLTAPTEEAATITIAGTALTGDQITALFSGLPGGPVAVTQAVTTAQSVTTIAGNLAAAITANAVLAAAGISATNLAGVVTLTVPAAVEPVVVSTWVNSNPLTAVIGGSVAVGGGDILDLIFTGAGITGSPVTVSYTTVAGDTTATIAVALAAAVNGTPVLSDVGIEASVTSSTISFVLGPTIGQMRLTESVPTGSETITVTATPTTTSTLGTAASETIVFSNSGKMSGGTGPVIATENFTWAFPGTAQTKSFWGGNPYNLGYDVVTAMVQQGEPIILVRLSIKNSMPNAPRPIAISLCIPGQRHAPPAGPCKFAAFRAERATLSKSSSVGTTNAAPQVQNSVIQLTQAIERGNPVDTAHGQVDGPYVVAADCRPQIDNVMAVLRRGQVVTDWVTIGKLLAAGAPIVPQHQAHGLTCCPRCQNIFAPTPMVPVKSRQAG